MLNIFQCSISLIIFFIIVDVVADTFSSEFCPKAVVLFKESLSSFIKPALFKPLTCNLSKKVLNKILFILSNSF